jgi:hypothetical protein
MCTGYMARRQCQGDQCCCNPIAHSLPLYFDFLHSGLLPRSEACPRLMIMTIHPVAVLIIRAKKLITERGARIAPLIVRDGKALAFDYADATARLEMAQHRAIEKVPRRDWGGRSAAELMPRTFRSR